ncbi:MAG: YncE family protein [Myxococcales bacterium]|nr:YncE family protein [Myxococcales bacterium]
MKYIVVVGLLLGSALATAVPRRSLVVESKLKLGAQPVDLAWQRDGRGIFVSLQASGVLLEIRHRHIARRALIGRGLSGLALAPDGRTLYATVSHANQLVKIDTKTLRVEQRVATCANPYGIKLSADGRFIAVACYNDAALVLASTFDLRSQRRIAVCKHPYHPEITPKMQRIYLTCYGSNALALISLETRSRRGTLRASDLFPKLVKLVPVGKSPQGLSFSPDGKRIVVANSTSDDISVLDLEGRQTRHVKVGRTPYFALFSPSGDRLLVTNRFSNSLSVIGPGTQRAEIRVDRGGLVARFSPNGRTLAIVHFDTGWLSLIE